MPGRRQFLDTGPAASRAFDDPPGDALADRMGFAFDNRPADTIKREIHPGKRTRIKCSLDHGCPLLTPGLRPDVSQTSHGRRLTFDMQVTLEHSRAWGVNIVTPLPRSPQGRGLDGAAPACSDAGAWRADFSKPRKVGMSPESTMPRYHFDLVNTKTITDQGGAELLDDIEAIDSADALARRILDEQPDLKSRHYSILVTNEDGDEICRLPFDIIH